MAQQLVHQLGADLARLLEHCRIVAVGRQLQRPHQANAARLADQRVIGEGLQLGLEQR